MQAIPHMPPVWYAPGLRTLAHYQPQGEKPMACDPTECSTTGRDVTGCDVTGLLISTLCSQCSPLRDSLPTRQSVLGANQSLGTRVATLPPPPPTLDQSQAKYYRLEILLLNQPH